MFKYLAQTLRTTIIAAGGKSSAIIPQTGNFLQCKSFCNKTSLVNLQLQGKKIPLTWPLLGGGFSKSEGSIFSALKCVQDQQVRTVTKFSIRKGKRKSVKPAIDRFFRLAWGGWIRTRAGRFKRLWTKSENRRCRYRQHVCCNATQCTLLDKMVTKYWKKRRYYVDDPYEPYHTREEFIYTAIKPLPLSYHLENNPKLNPKKKNEVTSYFSIKDVNPNLKYKLK